MNGDQRVTEKANLKLDESKIPEILRLVRKKYAGWNSFDNPQFRKDETDYKRQAAQKAQTLLSKSALTELLAAADYTEIIRRVRQGAQATNLMYIAHPSTGDLNLLNLPDLDESAFCAEFFALLYDDEPTTARLTRFFAYVQRQNSPLKWTFPTYYLFLLYPEKEIFIKPSMTGWFIRLVSGPNAYSKTPSGEAYTDMRAVFYQLKEALHDYGPHNMIDIHSLVWAAYQEAKKETNRKLGQPFSNMFADIEEAEWAFDLMADMVERVGGRGPDDPRFALTLAPGYLRLNFGNWVILDFPSNRVCVALQSNLIDEIGYKGWGEFYRSDVQVYEIPRSDARPFTPQLQRAYEDTCVIIRERFAKWRGTPYRRAHLPRVFDALYDPDLRETLLQEGLFKEQIPISTPEDRQIEIIDEPNSALKYDREAFLQETYLPAGDLEEMEEMLADKSQLIFYGPPGTGKTFVARALGKLLTGLADPPPERVELVQFHPAYGYEEFIEGIRPESVATGDGRYQIDYPIKAGVFRTFCERAAKYPDEKYIFIIDEINRGNVARIFGELMLLLEYRNEAARLPYSGERFRIPQNVVLLGTMNTADRSIALVDFALRRRFHFFRFGADPTLLDRWLAENKVAVPYLSRLYRTLTEEAIDDLAYQIGPSYFMRPGLTEVQLRGIWRRSILPYLAEYYVENASRTQRWEWDSRNMKEIRNGNG